jgi:hypothetical protein
MTPQEIRDAIAASPELQALGQDAQAIADALSVGRTKVVPRMTSSRGLAELMPGGPFAAEVVLMKLEGTATALAASADQQEKVLASLLKRQLSFLAGEGLDFGSVALRGMLDQFGTMGILTAGEVDGLKSIARAPDPVTAAEVERAMLPISPTWTGAVQSTRIENGMVYVTILYTSSVGATKSEQTWGDDITPAAVAETIRKRTESLTKADAALALFGE